MSFVGCSLAGSSPVLLLAVRGAGASCPRGVLSSRVVLAVGRAVWIMWRGRLLAVLVVYLYRELVVYIV